MRKLIAAIVLGLSLALPGAPALADAPCQPVAGDVTQVPNGVEHFTQLHATAHTTVCTARTWAQVSVTVQSLQTNGTWANVVSAASPAKYISPTCRTTACKSASVVVDRNPCFSGTFRAVATGGNTALPPVTNIGPVATIDCYGDA